MSSPIPARTPRPAAAGTTPTPGRTARARLALIVGLGEGPARAIRIAGLIAAGTVAVGAFLPWATGSDQSDNPGSYLIAGVSTFDGVFILVLGVIAGVLVARRTITGLLLSLVPFAVTAWTAVDVIAEPWTLAVDDSESIRGRALAGLFVTAAGGFAGVTLVVVATAFLATTTVQISRGVSPVHAPARIGALICGAATAVTAFLPWVRAPYMSDDGVAVGPATGLLHSLAGIVALVAGILVVAFAATGGRARLFWTAVPSTAIVAAAGWTLIDCLRPDPAPDPDGWAVFDGLNASPDPDYGLWVTLAVGVLAIICSLLAGATAPRATPPRPTAPTPSATSCT